MLDVDRFKSKTNLQTTKEDEIGILSKLLALPGPLYAMVYYHKPRKVKNFLKFSLTPTLMPQLLVKLNTKREGTGGVFQNSFGHLLPPSPLTPFADPAYSANCTNSALLEICPTAQYH